MEVSLSNVQREIDTSQLRMVYVTSDLRCEKKLHTQIEKGRDKNKSNNIQWCSVECIPLPRPITILNTIKTNAILYNIYVFFSRDLFWVKTRPPSVFSGIQQTNQEAHKGTWVTASSPWRRK